MQHSGANQIVKCPNCGANNRISTTAAGEKQAVCGRCRQALPNFSSTPVVVTDRNFGETVEKSALPVLLDLWAAWCGPCRMIAPIVERLAQELAGKVLVGKLNVDENPSTAARFHVQGIPTLLILRDGREVDRIVGVESRESILNRLQRFV
ncbi:MAG TPA: thioredoxin [Pyrinomonadaceae bacterium]|jgi:thioredoxin 2